MKSHTVAFTLLAFLLLCTYPLSFVALWDPPNPRAEPELSPGLVPLDAFALGTVAPRDIQATRPGGYTTPPREGEAPCATVDGYNEYTERSGNAIPADAEDAVSASVTESTHTESPSGTGGGVYQTVLLLVLGGGLVCIGAVLSLLLWKPKAAWKERRRRRLKRGALPRWPADDPYYDTESSILLADFEED